MPVVVACLIVLAVAPLVYAITTRNKAPFFMAWALGGVGGAIAGISILIGMGGATQTEYGILLPIIFGVPTGGPAGSALVTVVATFLIPPPERSRGALIGLAMGLAWGWLLVRLVPVDEGGQMSATVAPIAFLAACAVVGALTGGLVGASATDWSSQRQDTVLRQCKIGFAIAAIPALLLSQGTLHHVTDVRALGKARHTNGILWKVNHGEQVAYAMLELGDVYDGEDPRVVPALIGVIEGTHRAVRRPRRYGWGVARAWATKSLGKTEDPRALPVLIKCATDPNGLVRNFAIRGLARTRDEQAWRVIRSALNHESWGTRKAAWEVIYPDRPFPEKRP